MVAEKIEESYNSINAPIISRESICKSWCPYSFSIFFHQCNFSIFPQKAHLKVHMYYYSTIIGALPIYISLFQNCPSWHGAIHCIHHLCITYQKSTTCWDFPSNRVNSQILVLKFSSSEKVSSFQK